METLANFIGTFIYGFIAVLAIITIFGFVSTVSKINKLKSKMEEDRKKSGGRKEYTEGGIKKEADVYTWEDNLGYLESFNKIQLKCSMFEQFVPVFPLLGILGTVAGLIQHLANIQQMQDALSVSMWTTFWGLIAAIVFKIVDAILVRQKVDEMALHFDSFEQDYQMVKDKHSQETGADHRG